MENSKFGRLTDSELYQKCKEYGGNARAWMKKFAGLLPEVYRRKLYKRRGCASVHEFAGKLAGMSHDTTTKILQLDEKLKDKPTLHALLESGEVGWSKLETVAYAANLENEKDLAEKVKILPKEALQAYVREFRGKNNRLESPAGGTFQPEKITVPMPLDPKTKSRLELLKQKIEKAKGMAMSWDEAMTELMDGYENPKTSKTEKSVTINVCAECVKRKSDTQEIENPSRHIPADVKRIVDDRSKGTCEYPLCLRPAVTYHHTRRYALRPNHDPAYIVHLCKIHNALAHATLIENEEEMPENWKLRKERDRDEPKFKIDQRVAEFRQG